MLADFFPHSIYWMKLVGIVVLFVRIFLFNPNPFTPSLLKYYPPIQSKKVGIWGQGLQLSAATVYHDEKFGFIESIHSR
jgi:hypothetical protein